MVRFVLKRSPSRLSWSSSSRQHRSCWSTSLQDQFTRFGSGGDLRARAERAAAGFDRPLPSGMPNGWSRDAPRSGTSLRFQQPVAPLFILLAINTAMLRMCSRRGYTAGSLARHLHW